MKILSKKCFINCISASRNFFSLNWRSINLNKTILLLFFSFVFFIASFSYADENIKKLNIFLYMAADNDLHDSSINDIEEIRKVMNDKVNKNINFSIFFDGKLKDKKLFKEDAKADGFYLYWNDKGEEVFDYFREEVNSGDYRNFEKFLRYSFNKFKAEKTMVILWNHGGGWKDSYSTVEINLSRNENLSLENKLASIFLSLIHI